MTAPLTERLLAHWVHPQDCHKAASELTRLQGEVERLYGVIHKASDLLWGALGAKGDGRDGNLWQMVQRAEALLFADSAYGNKTARDTLASMEKE